MDGPNVNWKFYSMLTDEAKREHNSHMLNIGSCGLHILHGAFKDGAVASGWQLDRLFSSLHWLFQDSPARREDYTKVTGSSLFALKFCKHRWLENVLVAERTQSMWDSVVKYVQSARAGKVPQPQNKSSETVQEFVADPFTTAKVAFYLSVAKQVTPFLTLYQTDKPMLPFLATDLYSMLGGLMRRFIKTTVISEAKTPLKLTKLDPADSSIHASHSKIDLGFTADKKIKELIAKATVSEKRVLQFQMECKEFLMKVVCKLIAKAPIQYSLVRNINCLDPRNMMSDHDVSITKFKRVLTTLENAKKVLEGECDSLLELFRQFIMEAPSSSPSEFKDYDPNNDRLDSFLYLHMGQKRSYQSLWKVVADLLILSRGQASVERGFPVNKQLEVENLQEWSFISQRLAQDHVLSVGGVHAVSISKPLLLSAAGARQKYSLYLDEQKRKKTSEGVKLKRKELVNELDECKKKRRHLEADVDSLVKSADEFAQKAEDTGKLVWITKSNSLRRTAKEKEMTRKDIEDKILNVVDELKKTDFYLCVSSAQSLL